MPNKAIQWDDCLRPWLPLHATPTMNASDPFMAPFPDEGAAAQGGYDITQPNSHAPRTAKDLTIYVCSSREIAETEAYKKCDGLPPLMV